MFHVFVCFQRLIVWKKNVVGILLGLIDYIKKTKQLAVRVETYDIRHNVTIEAKLNLNQSILQQRRFWMRHDFYDKPLLTSMTLHWTTGFHLCSVNVNKYMSCFTIQINFY